MKSEKEISKPSLSPPMAALIGNIQYAADLWGKKPYAVLAAAGVSPGLWYQWAQGQAAGMDMLDRLSEWMRVEWWELVRPDALKGRGNLANPFPTRLTGSRRSSGASNRRRRYHHETTERLNPPYVNKRTPMVEEEARLAA